MVTDSKGIFATSNGFKVPYNIFYERRKSARAAIGQKGLSIRIPDRAGNNWKEEKITDFFNWLDNLALKNPVSLIRFFPFKFFNTQNKIQ